MGRIDVHTDRAVTPDPVEMTIVELPAARWRAVADVLSAARVLVASESILDAPVELYTDLVAAVERLDAT
jgi:hypothetical protein